MFAVLVLALEHSEVEFILVLQTCLQPEVVQPLLFIVVILGTLFVVLLLLQYPKLFASLRLRSFPVLPVWSAILE